MTEKANSESIIISKTPEQLKQQTDLVNLQKTFSDHNSIKPDRPLSEQEVEKYKKYQRLSPENRKSASRRFGADPFYLMYDEYIKALRELRQSQRIYLKESRGSASFLSRENYLEAVGFSPALAKDVLSAVSYSLRSVSKIELTSEEITKAASSKENFDETLDRVLNVKPEIFYSYDLFDKLKYALSPEKTKKIVLKLGPGWNFLRHYSDLKSLLSVDEQRQLISPSFSDDDCSEMMVDLFKDPGAVSLYPRDQIKRAVERGLKERNKDLIKDDIAFYSQNGLISSADARNIIFSRIKQFKSIKDINGLVPFLPPEITPVDIKKEVMEAYITNGEPVNLPSLVHLASLLDLNEKNQIIRTLMFRKPDATVPYFIDSLEELLPLEHLQPLLREYITDNGTDFNGYSVNQILATKTLTLGDKEGFFNQQIRNNKADYFLEYFDENINQFPEEKRNTLAENALNSASPKKLAECFNKWEKFVSDHTLKDIMNKIEKDYDAVETSIYSISIWGRRLGKDYAQDFIKRFQSTHAGDMFNELDSILAFIPDDEKKDFVSQLIKTNPLAALYGIQESAGATKGLSRIGFTLTPQMIIDTALNDKDRVEYAPKFFREFYRRFSLDKSLDDQKALVTEAALLQKSLAFIEFHGLSEDLRKVQKNADISLNTEKELISTFYCFALLKTDNPDQFALIGNLGTNVKESKQILFNNLSRLLGKQEELTDQAVDSFFGAMESPIPFFIYLLQYKDSPAHRELLTQIFNSIISGKFSEWKYGLNTPESLDQLKQAKLIPERLTFEQYSVWRNDGQTTLFESLATDTETVANAVHNYLEANLNHLEIQEALDHLMANYPNQDLLVSLQQDLASTGQQLAVVNKELTAMQKQNVSQPEVLENLRKTKISLEKQRKDLLRTRKIFRLVSIKPHEIASGYFLGGKDLKQREELIKDILEELRKSSEEGNNFIYDEIRKMIDSLKDSSEKRNLACVDSSDPKVWIEIGEKPVASCQSYDHGVYNDCLLAYTDPNTKILVLRNEKGEIVARSIFRLLETSSGQPALHIERIYSSSTSKGVLRSMFTRSYQKAQEMGLPLFISEASQNENDVEEEVQLAEGYQLQQADGTLLSKSSRAPEVYVDSAGGVNYAGQFEIKKLTEIVKATL